MILNRRVLLLGARLILAFLICLSGKQAWSAPLEDIESRFIYADYSKKISMDFKDASLIDVLKIFSKQSGKNFISAADVSSKKVTVFLDNVSIDEALEKILDVNDLTYEMDSNSDVFVVKPKSKEQNRVTKVFVLKNASVTTSKISSDSSKSGVLAAIKQVLSTDGKMEEDSRTNSLIITDIPEQFPLIAETITKLDVDVAQILIQVEMIDVNKSVTDKLGMSYGNFPNLSVTGSKSGLLYRNSSSDTAPGTLSYATSVAAALDFLKSQSDSRILARPRILTLNNQTATIEISTDEAIGLSASQTSVGTSGSTSSTGAERTKTGVTLEVTPQANIITGEIILSVNPKVIVASPGSIINPSNGQAFKDPEERSTKSILKVKNGETFMIGGLLRTQNSIGITNVPFLGDIPIIGAAFRHKAKESTERELVIFITTNIINDKLKQDFDSANIVRFNREFSKPKRLDSVNQQLDSTEIGK